MFFCVIQLLHILNVIYEGFFPHYQGSRLSVAFFMLDKVPAPELIAATVETSVRPYAEEHTLPFDELLLQYIKVKRLYQ